MRETTSVCVCEREQNQSICFCTRGAAVLTEYESGCLCWVHWKVFGVGYITLISTRRSSGQVLGWIIGAKSASRHEDYAL